MSKSSILNFKKCRHSDHEVIDRISKSYQMIQEQSELDNQIMQNTFRSLTKDLKKISKQDFLDLLMESIKEIKYNESCLMISLNKSLIIETENSALISNGINVQLAHKIHLNPILENRKDLIHDNN